MVHDSVSSGRVSSIPGSFSEALRRLRSGTLQHGRELTLDQLTGGGSSSPDLLHLTHRLADGPVYRERAGNISLVLTPRELNPVLHDGTGAIQQLRGMGAYVVFPYQMGGIDASIRRGESLEVSLADLDLAVFDDALQRPGPFTYFEFTPGFNDYGLNPKQTGVMRWLLGGDETFDEAMRQYANVWEPPSDPVNPRPVHPRVELLAPAYAQNILRRVDAPGGAIAMVAVKGTVGSLCSFNLAHADVANPLPYQRGETRNAA